MRTIANCSIIATHSLKNLTTVRPCPEGFIVKCLEEQHAEVVAPTWSYTDNLQAKISYFKQFIKHLHSVGIFSKEDPDKPVAWCTQYVYGQPAHLYVTDEYRRRGFASLMMEHMCECIQADGLLPGIGVDLDNARGMELMKKMGFVKYGNCTYLCIGTVWCFDS